MVNFNGNFFSGNVVIVDGQVISGEPVKKSSTKKFDETKKQLADDIRRIIIDSNSVNVKVSASNTKEVIAHLYGSTAEPDFSVSRRGDELTIRVKAKGRSVSSKTVIMGNCTISNCVVGGGLELDVQVPTKIFEEISVESNSGDIGINSNVKASSIRINSGSGDVEIESNVVSDVFSIKTLSGDVDLSAAFRTLRIACSSGDIDVDSKVYCDVKLAVRTSSGDIDVALEDIGRSTVSVETNCGKCRNNPKLKGDYTATGYIKASSGNVKFH